MLSFFPFGSMGVLLRKGVAMVLASPLFFEPPLLPQAAEWQRKRRKEKKFFSNHRGNGRDETYKTYFKTFTAEVFLSGLLSIFCC